MVLQKDENQSREIVRCHYYWINWWQHSKARLYYVLFFDGDKYLKDPISILYIHEGGLGIYGGIIGGLLAGGITAKIQKLNVLSALDVAGLGFSQLGRGFGRWGNFEPRGLWFRNFFLGNG